MKPKSGSDVF